MKNLYKISWSESSGYPSNNFTAEYVLVLPKKVSIAKTNMVKYTILIQENLITIKKMIGFPDCALVFKTINC